MKKKKILKIFHIVCICVMMLLALVPFYFLLVTGLSEKGWRNIFIPQFDFSGFAIVWEKSNFGTALFNTMIITIIPLILIVLLTSSAGYVFARSKSKFNKVAFALVLFSMMIPGIINTVPLYTLMRQINGINTRWAVILLLTADYLPFATFLYTSFIKKVSPEMEEAAYIDGCTKFEAFWLVVFPTLKPVTATIIILDAVGLWNTYTTALFFLQKQELAVVTQAISRFIGTYGAEWNLMAAAAILGLVPPVLVFLSFQKYFIKGLAAGATKG